MAKLRAMARVAGVLFTALFFGVIATGILLYILTNIIDPTLQYENLIESSSSKPLVLGTLSLGQGLGFLLTYLFFNKLVRKTNDSFKIEKEHLRDILIGTGVIFGLYLIFSTSMMFFGIPTPDHVLLEDLEGANIVFLAVVFFSASIIAPLTEELIFRGLIQEYLIEGFDVRVAFLITSLLFGSAHYGSSTSEGLSGLSIVTLTFLISLVLCIYKEKTRTLMVPILIHFTYNTIILILVISGFV